MKKMSVGIFGFGKAGKSVVTEFLKEQDFEVAWVIRKGHEDAGKCASHLLGMEVEAAPVFSLSEVSADFFSLHPVDVLVDFSDSAAVQSYRHAADTGTVIISAVSKYEPDDLALLQALATNTAVLYSPNITLGINILMIASQVMQKIAPHADIEIIEEHFKGKPEISGTAKKIADGLAVDHEHIRSVRAGGIIGRHEIIFGLPNQTIRMVHDSISRAAFGQGAIFAARHMQDKPKGLYTMEQIIQDLFRDNLPPCQAAV